MGVDKQNIFLKRYENICETANSNSASFSAADVEMFEKLCENIKGQHVWIFQFDAGGREARFEVFVNNTQMRSNHSIDQHVGGKFLVTFVVAEWSTKKWIESAFFP